MRTSAFVLSLFFMIVCLESGASVETMTAAPQSKPTGICAGIFGDSVRIVSLRVVPSNTSNTSTSIHITRISRDRNPANLNIEMAIINVSGRDLIGVAWGITSDDGQANTGYVNIPRCSSVKVSLLWPRQLGTHTFTGDVDPNNTLGESTSGFENNHQTFVYAPSVILVRQMFDYERTRVAGAAFLDNILTPISNCTRIGQGNAENSGDYGTGQPGVVFVADSPYIGSAFGIQAGTGCSANPEAFKDFHLKNGWRVESVSLKFATSKGNLADMRDSLEEAQSPEEQQQQSQGFHPMTTPTIGSDDPHIQVHIAVRAAAFLKVYARITIEGPQGTDPYGGTMNSCAAGFVPVTTPSGPGCALADDVERCGTPLVGFNCVTNGDCTSGTICATSPCANKCVRGHAP